MPGALTNASPLVHENIGSIPALFQQGDLSNKGKGSKIKLQQDCLNCHSQTEPIVVQDFRNYLLEMIDREDGLL